MVPSNELIVAPVSVANPTSTTFIYSSSIFNTSLGCTELIPLKLNCDRPEIYFGEKTFDYVVVNTKQQEFDFPKGDLNVYTNYEGDGGILFDSFLKNPI